MKTDYTSLIFLLVGVYALWIEVFLPSFAPYNPMTRWFPPWGPVASKFARVTGAVGCLLIAAHLMDLIPTEFQVPVAAIWCVAIMFAAIYDSTLTEKQRIHGRRSEDQK